MTVEELIKALEVLPPKMVVEIYHPLFEGWEPLKENDIHHSNRDNTVHLGG